MKEVAPSSNPDRTLPSQGGNRGSNPLGARYTIAIDGMGGDKAPDEIIRGAVKASSLGVNILLTGDANRLEPLLKQLKRNEDVSHIHLIHAPKVVGMEDDPMSVFREKSDSSIATAVKLLYERVANAAISAGNSGAFYASAVRYLRFSVITRPSFAVLLPNLKGKMLLLDVGANIDCLPFHLVDFALLGDAYMRLVEKIPEPKVALLNIGEEPNKGNMLLKKAYQLLQNTPIHFIGNIQGRELLSGMADVVVTDGLLGNVVLKTVEGVGKSLRRVMMKQKKGGFLFGLALRLLSPSVKNVLNTLDYQEYGGGLILGVKGVCVVAHGSATSRAIFACIEQCKQILDANFIPKLEEYIILNKKRRGKSVLSGDYGSWGLSPGENPE